MHEKRVEISAAQCKINKYKLIRSRQELKPGLLPQYYYRIISPIMNTPGLDKIRIS